MAKKLITEESLQAAVTILKEQLLKDVIVIPPTVVEDYAIDTETSNNGDGEYPSYFINVPPDLCFTYQFAFPATLKETHKRLSEIFTMREEGMIIRGYKVVIQSNEGNAVVLYPACILEDHTVLFYPIPHNDGVSAVYPVMTSRNINVGNNKANRITLSFITKRVSAPEDGSLYGLKNGDLVEICSADQSLLAINKSSVASVVSTASLDSAPSAMLMSDEPDQLLPQGEIPASDEPDRSMAETDSPMTVTDETETI
ncbi:MAG: hypothetical protein K2L89_00135 [Muribaculaceae bacterium]|nr:hypothetical protein [Muribaculaceae bacterium]